MLDNVVTVLTWSGTSSAPDHLYASAVERLATAIRAKLARMERFDADAAAALRRKLNACSEEALLRFLTAPETFARLATTQVDYPALFQYVDESVDAELSREGHSTESGGRKWTALGDYCSPKGRNPVVFFQPDTGRVDDDAPHHALNADGLPVDFNGPYSQGRDIPVDGPYASYKAATQRRTMAALHSALQGVSTIAPPARHCVDLFTRIIVVRKDPAHTSFLSSSSPRYVGRTVLCNPHRVSVEELADGLVHESIHGLLSTIQLEVPFVLNCARVSTAEVVSPWTGNIIPTDAFLEACFVWFGLWHLWSLASNSDTFAYGEVRRLRHRAAFGFAGAPLVDQLADVAQSLTPETLTTVSTMQDVVHSEL
jgi:HEXXH motif-containing protein